ncbi:unnamed protein product [Urochloa humidicola]
MGQVDGSSAVAAFREARRTLRPWAVLAYVAALVSGFLPGLTPPLLRQGSRVLLYRQMAASVLVAALLYPAGLRSPEMAESLKLKELELQKWKSYEWRYLDFCCLIRKRGNNCN